MTEKYLTGEDGNIIFKVVKVTQPDGSELEALIPFATWNDLAKAVKEMERIASQPCFLCTDFDNCEVCPDFYTDSS